MEIWNGFKLERTTFEDRELITVYPEKPNGKWAIKTEYFNAFPDVQIKLLELGYHVFHLQNNTRWHVNEDTEKRAKLAEYVHDKMGLSQKCVIIGMSCGGMQGIYFGAKYPEYVSCLYLDAPVVNLFSCPAGFGKKVNIDALDELLKGKNMTMTEFISYREHPLDYLPELVKHNIPLMLVAGDSDSVVPYDENGILLHDAYKKAGCIMETIIKPGCDHHPHSLEDNSPIIEFIKKYDI
ncbi:MAG: alpha/beta fold hydrolase [Clostridia bacterium]|nr:alpha/beta fold hydrolase [Clostridia bacterium]